jgi:Lrp/AsnC family transcriptional regulator for asnA, asnC and gidA
VTDAGDSTRLDRIDRAILGCLRVDGRMSHTQIAVSIDATETTVRRHLRQLQTSGVLRLVPVIDPDRIGLRTSVLVGVKANAQTLDKVATKIAEFHEVRYVALTTGPYDLFVEAFVGSREKLAELLIERISQVPGVVSTETFTILRIAKFAYEWEIPDDVDLYPGESQQNSGPGA